jgi:3-oxoacyl-[acyl-carrier-protein] synthase III
MINDQENQSRIPEAVTSFFSRPRVRTEEIPLGRGVPFGLEQIFHPEIGIGGAYGTWGKSYDNEALKKLAARHFGGALSPEEEIDLLPIGFVSRHHIGDMTPEEHVEVEVEVGARTLREAAQASGWDPKDVEGVIIGVSGPVADDYTERIAQAAGIPEHALKVSVHKACDSAVSGLHMALNPDLPINRESGRNIAQELMGKKVLVGGIEGLSRFVNWSHDKMAFQIFGNGTAVIGVIPGETMNFLVGKEHEVFDEEGVLAVKMFYPHSGKREVGHSMVEVSQPGANHFRIAGFMHEPEDGTPVIMAGPMGMVKLFVRTGVQVVREVYTAYQGKMSELGISGKNIAVTVVHHANLKINRLKEKTLHKEGIPLSMPWVLSDFGNVSAASTMIAFLRQLPSMKPGDHILFDGFGAGTYYDAMAVALGRQSKTELGVA